MGDRTPEPCIKGCGPDCTEISHTGWWKTAFTHLLTGGESDCYGRSHEAQQSTVEFLRECREHRKDSRGTAP
jgi:hypothetical protein